jgi:nitrous oxide reductase accessory protein NosL
MHLRKIGLFVCLCVMPLCSFPGSFAEAEEPSCFYCGMYRSKFEHSWVMITHEDGSSVSVCSIHCAAIDMALHPAKNIRKITVGDYDTKKPIDADNAYWVIGGDIMGVMTARAKWAFATKAGADNFMKKHGGRPANFRKVIKAAFEDMYQDTLMIRKKRKLINMRKNQSQ